jgi:Protein of unknown function (DUF2505)
VLEFTLNHGFNCSTERFWTLFFDPAWTRALILEGLGFATCDIDPVVEAGGKKSRSMRVTPKLDLPAAVAKLLGPKLGYTENGRLDLASGEWSYEIVMSVMSERIRLGGRLSVEPDGPDKCRRRSSLWTEVKIFGIGALVEKAAEKNMRDGWEKAAVWTRDWLASHPNP